MMNRMIRFLVVALLAFSIVSPPAYADGSPAQPTVREDFYRELADLVNKQERSKFFGEMELQVGSNILAVDGEEQSLAVAPEITDNRTMLPIRAVAEAAGAEVGWDSDTSTVLIESACGDEISCTIGSNAITVNDETSLMDVTPYARQGNAYMPIWAVAEALELDLEWDGETQMIRLSAPYQTARLLVLADKLDTYGLETETVISDGTGLWVLQFSTPAQAKEAAGILETRGIVTEPDRYIPPIEDITTPAGAQSEGHYSWGAADCGFDTFVSSYSGLFSSRGVVAVVDTGVDSSHPFLRNRVLNGYDFIDGDNTPYDGHSHGTHVAGTVIDCVGSAPVSILPVRVLDNQGRGTDSTVAAGIKYAADHGTDVINLSLGGGCSKAEDSAVSYAIGKGCLVVASAGNDNESTANHCPAHIMAGGTVVVSAGDASHNKAAFSNYGSSVDLMAPGVGIKASVPGGGFGHKSGTSMAAPHAAAAAMLLDLAWSETLTPAALEKELRSATTYGSWTNQTVGCGFLDLMKANRPPAAVKPGISLNRGALSMETGDSQTLAASVTPSGTAVSWSSSNTSVATVSGGKVTAVGQGTATITARINYDKTSYYAHCAVTVSGGGKIGEWTTAKLPEKDGYNVETKVQYQFKSKELTQSSQSTLPGWTLYDTKTEYTWGSWTEWKNGSAFNVGDNVQLETRQTEGTSTRYYDLYYYKYWNTSYNKIYYTYSAPYAIAQGGTKYTATAPASECRPSQSYDGQQAYSYNGFNLWWIENVRDVTTPGQQYRMRTKAETKTYYYYRWSDWSAWKDAAVAEEDSVRVETRLLYRYVPVN